MDEDNFVARRGSQGDEWNWEGQRPTEPLHPTSPAPANATSAGLRRAARRMASWPIAAAAAIAGSLGRLRHRPDASSRGSRPRLRRITAPEVSEGMRAPLTLFAALALATVIVVVIAILIAALDDGSSDGGIAGGPSESPTEANPSPSQSELPSTTPTDRPTREPTATTTPQPTLEPTLPPITPSAPQGGVTLGLWANVRNEWWFTDLSEEAASYEEGETVPFLIAWDAQPGQPYEVQIVYDCATDDAFGAIDYLSGMDGWDSRPVLTQPGPGTTTPEGAIPVPDTEDFAIDDADTGVILSFGGRFSLLPLPVQPSGDCDRQRLIRLPVQASSERVVILASLHLATDDVWGQDEGAASHDPPFGMQVVVSGVGEAGISIQPGTVSLGE